MHKYGFALLAVMMLAGAGTARAALPAPVQSALSILQRSGSELAHGWRYRETIHSAENKLKLAYDPSRPAGERWQVLKVNGQAPKKSDRQQLSKQAAKTAKKAGQGLDIGSGWLTASHYELVKKTDDTLVYRIQPRAASGVASSTAALLKHLTGRLVVAREDHRPISLHLSNFESFSPRFGVDIQRFSFSAEFKRLGGTGPVVVVRTSNVVKGEVFWFNDFKDKTKVVLSHFAPVAASAPVAVSATAPATASLD